jgi:diphthine synthase
MLHIIGLGLNKDGISREGVETIKKCKRVYLESYTVELPYKKDALEEFLLKKVHLASREFIESGEIIDEARKKHVALLVYGSPLTATTHISLLEEAEESGVDVEIIYGASVFDAVAETGLQLYKFGKIVSMPKWQKNFEPDSFLDIVKQNQSIDAHTLLLIDIGLEFHDAVLQLEEACKRKNMKLHEKIIVCQRLGTKREKIFYDKISRFKEKRDIIAPFCIIIPAKLHFTEQDFLESRFA